MKLFYPLILVQLCCAIILPQTTQLTTFFNKLVHGESPSGNDDRLEEESTRSASFERYQHTEQIKRLFKRQLNNSTTSRPFSIVTTSARTNLPGTASTTPFTPTTTPLSTIDSSPVGVAAVPITSTTVVVVQGTNGPMTLTSNVVVWEAIASATSAVVTMQQPQLQSSGVRLLVPFLSLLCVLVPMIVL